MKIKRSSLHYRLATFYGNYNVYSSDERTVNICPYARSVLLGLGSIFFILVAGWMASYLVGDLLAYIAAMITMHQLILPDERSFVLIFGLSAGLFVWLLFVLARGIKRIGQKIRQEKFEKTGDNVEDPSFLMLWYRSVKDKMCIPITIEDDQTKENR